MSASRSAKRPARHLAPGPTPGADGTRRLGFGYWSAREVMDFREVVRRRRMVRRFDARPVPADVLERVLEAARRGPSAGYSQGFDLLVLAGPEQTARYWDVTLPPDR